MIRRLAILALVVAAVAAVRHARFATSYRRMTDELRTLGVR